MLRTVGSGAAVASMGALAGCSGGGGEGEGEGEETTEGGGGGETTEGGGGETTGGMQDITLEVWLSYYTEGANKREATDELFAEMEEELGYTLNITGVPYVDVETEFQSARAAGNVPHLVEVMTRPGVLTGGAGMVINDLWESSTLSDAASEKVMNGHRVWGAQSTGEEGNLVTVPLGLRPFLTCWRQDWLDQAGIAKEDVDYRAGSLHWYDDIPGIYDQLKETDLGQQDGKWPDTTGMKQSDCEYVSIYVPQHGGSLSGPVNTTGTEATINSSEAVEAFTMQKDYLENGYFHENSINHGDEESTTLHWAGDVAQNHIQDSTDLWADYQLEQEDRFNDGFYSWGPPFNAGTKACLSWLPCLGFMEEGFAGQNEIDAAMEMLEYWVGEKPIFNAETLGFVPVDPSQIQEEDFFGQSEMHEQFWRGASAMTLEDFDAATIPAVPGASAITYEIPRQMYQRILQQGEDVQAAADTAAEEIQSILDENQ